MNALQRKANEYELMASIALAASTPRLIEEVKQMCKEEGTMAFDAVPCCNREFRTSIRLNTGYNRDKSYEEILFMDGATLDSNSVYATKKIRKGYVTADIDYIADVPKEVIELLHATGNITTFVSTYTNISCTL